MTPRKKPPPPAIAVLGMHRSGTSCLTGLLGDAGVFLGNVSKQNPHNRKGNQENLRIMHLHNAVLAENRGSWDNPPQVPVSWSAEHKATQAAIIREYTGQPCWAFKDPRTLYTLEGWREAVPELACVGTFRHPTAVAQSLLHRNKFPRDEALALWTRYNEQLLFYQKRFHFPLVDFDLELEAYLQRVTHVLQSLHLPTAHSNLRFFGNALRHEQPDLTLQLPPVVAQLYTTLREVSAQ